ncbi:MAG: pseudouridine synthase [Nitrospiria bacterium]
MGSRLKEKKSLSRALSKMGITSRAVASQLILSGKVKLGNKVILDPEYQVSLPVLNLQINDKPIHTAKKVYFIMHKPKGVITSRDDEKGRKTIYDLLGPELPWIFPVGRLDKESSGILFLTNDTTWGDQISSPIQKVPKTYHVKINKNITDEDIRKIKEGLKLSSDLVYLPAFIEKIRENKKSCWIEIILTEGKNRQIRKMLEHLNYRVENLVRIKIGNSYLGDLKPGELRAISPDDPFFKKE